MLGNPYRPPRPVLPADDALNESDRNLARRKTRLAVGILTLPAVYNVLSFNFRIGADASALVNIIYRSVNLIGFTLLILIVWYMGLNVFEFVTRICHRLIARNSTLEEWRKTLYQTILRSTPFAMVGAIVWAIWVLAIYQANVDFYVVSVPVAILSHLLAAGLYLPLILNWFKLEREASSECQN